MSLDASDRMLLCVKFAELRRVMQWQTVVLVAIAAGIGVQVPQVV